MFNLLVSAALAAVPSTCPPEVISQLDGLYEWHLKDQHRRDRWTLEPKKRLFTPELFNSLEEAWSLDPRVDGAYVDFIVFSGTQVSTFGAKVNSCRQLFPGVIEADVSVQAGLRGRTSEQPQQITYRLVQMDGNWKVSDLIYNNSDGQSSTLSTRLNDILRRAAESPRH